MDTSQVGIVSNLQQVDKFEGIVNRVHMTSDIGSWLATFNREKLWRPSIKTKLFYILMPSLSVACFGSHVQGACKKHPLMGCISPPVVKHVPMSHIN